MAGMGLLNSLMLNARCLVIPHFIYALKEEIGTTGISSQEVQKRIWKLVNQTLWLSERLK